MLTKVGVEQRRFVRAPFQRGVRFKVKDAPLFSSHLAQDISQGGIRFNSPSFVPLGTVLAVEIKLADEAPLFDMHGKVVWVKYIPHLETYQLGLEFSAENYYGRRKIARYAQDMA